MRNSILYAINNIDEAVNHAMSYSRGQSKDMITKFIKMYVNDITVDMGKNGEKALTAYLRYQGTQDCYHQRVD